MTARFDERVTTLVEMFRGRYEGLFNEVGYGIDLLDRAKAAGLQRFSVAAP